MGAAEYNNAPGQQQQQNQPIEMSSQPQHHASASSVPQYPQQSPGVQSPDSIRAQDANHGELPPAYPANTQQKAYGTGPGHQGNHPGLQPGAPHGNVTPLGALRHDGQIIDCPWCMKRATARMTEEGQGMQVVTGLVIGLFCICLACLPCCLNWFAERSWTCSECGHKVAMQSEGDSNPTIPITPGNAGPHGYAPGPQQVHQQQYQQQGPPMGMPQGQYQGQQQGEAQWGPGMQQQQQQQQQPQQPPMAHGK